MLIRAARIEFAQNGYSRTTVESITTRAGVAKGTYYLYFKHKEDIIYNIIEETADNISSILKEEYERFKNDSAPFYDIIYDIIERSVAEYMSLKDIFMTNPFIDFEISPRLAKFKHENEQKIFEYAIKIIELAIERGLVRKEINVAEYGSILIGTFTHVGKELSAKNQSNLLGFYTGLLRDLMLRGIGS